jgi:hypothetical protein
VRVAGSAGETGEALREPSSDAVGECRAPRRAPPLRQDRCRWCDRPRGCLRWGNLLLLIVGGNDTTRNSISGGLWFLNQFPEEYAKLRAGNV